MSKFGPAGTTMSWAQLWAIPRVPGDDDTDHIVRHAYGIDPDKEYRGAMFGSTPRAPRSPSKPRSRGPASSRSQNRAYRVAATSERIKRSLPPKVSLSRLVSVGLREAPDSGVTITRLVDKHLRSGKAKSTHRLFGMPLVITTKGKTVRVAFAMETK